MTKNQNGNQSIKIQRTNQPNWRTTPERQRPSSQIRQHNFSNTYWLIGRHIVEYEQGGKEKAEYGTFLFGQLSKDLTSLYGKGFSRSNLLYMRKLYLAFPKSETLSNVLSWSHYFEILRSDNDLEVGFYIKQAEKENWSVRELKRQMRSMLFHRLALSKDKTGIMALSAKGQEIQKPDDILRDPYVLEFLNIPEQYHYTSAEFEVIQLSYRPK